jgi:hypothetical protein
MANWRMEAPGVNAIMLLGAPHALTPIIPVNTMP